VGAPRRKERGGKAVTARRGRAWGPWTPETFQPSHADKILDHKARFWLQFYADDSDSNAPPLGGGAFCRGERSSSAPLRSRG